MGANEPGRPAVPGETVVDLSIPCTYDFEVASAKYFQALETGAVPLSLLFSGDLFHLRDGGLQIAQVSWKKEARFRLPVALLARGHGPLFPQHRLAPVAEGCLRATVAYKRERALPTWEAALDELLGAVAVR